MGTWIVGFVVFFFLFLAARSLWKNHKAGINTCTGCPSAKGCPHASSGCGGKTSELSHK